MVGFLAGAPFIGRTISLHEPKTENATVSVLSFNAKLFRKARTYEEFSLDMIEWTVQAPYDIKCIQEYSTNSRWPVLDVTGQFKTLGYSDFTFKSKMKNNEHSNGMAIFSKYPIVKAEVVLEDSISANAVLYADLQIGKDTVRIYNVHFESMNLQLYRLKSSDQAFGKLRDLISKLKNGAINRFSEINTLIEHTQSSPYPFIICGDFNETPYGYNYHHLHSLFDNSFEKAGNGFGFTLNSLLFFLRIDHHFYGKGINVQTYEVDRSMNISDHFPTIGYYTIK